MEIETQETKTIYYHLLLYLLSEGNKLFIIFFTASIPCTVQSNHPMRDHKVQACLDL